MYNLAVLDPARDTTARDESKVESSKTEGMKKHCQFSFLWILNKTCNINMEPQAKKETI